ncbi:hypothetical protein ABZ721_10560 [Streptomyces sp. NPDC006733]|uniref:hypothetical protein n=1 Tax=Streptomyces sp. NPDC006733 TaxID=3155460 RepID=UPI0033EE3D27
MPQTPARLCGTSSDTTPRCCPDQKGAYTWRWRAGPDPFTRTSAPSAHGLDTLTRTAGLAA